MNSEKNNNKIINVSKLFWAGIICLALIIISYYFLDKKLAIWINQQGLPNALIYKIFINLPNIAVYFSAFILLVIFTTTKFSKLTQKFPKTIIAVAFSTYVTLALVSLLKMIFGRTATLYWVIHNYNPNAYGFHLFHGYSTIYNAFPSGHSAAAFAILSVCWVVYPRFAWLGILFGLTTIVGLLATNSHFLSDCIAGAYIGTLVGLMTVRFFSFSKNPGEDANYPPRNSD